MAKGKVISDVDFVTAFAQCTTLDDVVSKLGMEKGSIQARASKLRKVGVKLPVFRRTNKPVDIAGLNAILEKHGKLPTTTQKTKGKR